METAKNDTADAPGSDRCATEGISAFKESSLHVKPQMAPGLTRSSLRCVNLPFSLSVTPLAPTDSFAEVRLFAALDSIQVFSSLCNFENTVGSFGSLAENVRITMHYTHLNRCKRIK